MVPLKVQNLKILKASEKSWRDKERRVEENGVKFSKPHIVIFALKYDIKPASCNRLLYIYISHSVLISAHTVTLTPMQCLKFPEKEYVAALIKELEFRSSLPEWNGRTLKSIYFGGGNTFFIFW